MQNTSYKEFLGNKYKSIKETGFKVNESNLNKNLFDFRYLVQYPRQRQF